jgi:hypothetical protein
MLGRGCQRTVFPHPYFQKQHAQEGTVAGNVFTMLPSGMLVEMSVLNLSEMSAGSNGEAVRGK